ncbi:unnamed protein product [Pelagomonas calceolata]|uniref:U-box domain-containing protein n=3 Tax=Pelagomonas calceolata TaxID=35677 RepID=A0A8J2WVJ9_9STRA|nr:unnamed protein product [Pelagomonas calceolata]
MSTPEEKKDASKLRGDAPAFSFGAPPPAAAAPTTLSFDAPKEPTRTSTDSPDKPAEDEVGILFQVADQEGVAQHAFRVNILREEAQSKPVLKLVQEVLINRNRQQTQVDECLPEILKGLRLPDAQFHRPDVGKRLAAGDTLLEPGETPDATVMLIAMCGGGARADMVLVVGDARGYVGSRALNIHRLGDRSLGDAAAAACELPRDEWARGVSASLALVNDDVAITEVSHQLVEAKAPWCGISIELDPTVPAAEALQDAPRPPLVLVRRADDHFARHGLKTTSVDIAWAGGRIEAIAVREWPVPRTPRMWAEWALRTVSAPLVLHGMMSPQLRDAVVQQAIESMDMDDVAVAVDGAPAAQMVPGDELEVAHPERLVIQTSGNLFQDQPENGSYLAVSAMTAACMRRLEAGEELYAPKSTWRALEVRSRLYKARKDDINAGNTLATAHTCLEFLHALGLFEAAGRLDRADAARAIDCVMEIESYFRAANAPIFTCVLGVDGAAREQAEIFASRLGVASFLTLRRVPELQKLQASIHGDYDETTVACRALEAVENVRRQLAMPNRESRTRGQPHVAAFCLSVLCQAAATRDRRAFVLGESRDTRVSLNLLLALPIDLLEAPLDESYLNPEQQSRLRETISDLLLLWDLVRPAGVSKDFRQHCEALADRAESKGESDAYVSGQMLRDLMEKLRGDRASKRAGVQRKLLLRKLEPDKVYSNLIVRDPPAGLRALLARFRVAPRLRDARPSPPNAPKPAAPAAPPTSWSDDEATTLPQHGSEAKKKKKLGAKAAKKKRQKERKKAAALRAAAARAEAPAVAQPEAREAAQPEAERAPSPDVDEAETASEASADDVRATRRDAAEKLKVVGFDGMSDDELRQACRYHGLGVWRRPDRKKCEEALTEYLEWESRYNRRQTRMRANVRAIVSARESVYVSQLPELYRRKYGRKLETYEKLTEFLAETPGLEMVDGIAGGSVRLAPVPAPLMSDDVASGTSLDAATAEAPPDDGAAEAEARARDDEAASLALARRLAAEDPVAPMPPAATSEQEDDFRLFLSSLGLGHHADRLIAESVESIEDLMLLTRADIMACGVPAADATRLEAALAAARGPTAAEESKSAPPPPPPGKVLVDEILDDAAARAAALETSLTAHQEELRRLKGLLTERGVPDGLVCPLSLEIYEDPVVAADGFSYERREIEAWLGRGNRTSPKTNEELPHTFLTPNRDLKSTCQDFLDDVRKFEAR